MRNILSTTLAFASLLVTVIWPSHGGRLPARRDDSPLWKQAASTITALAATQTFDNSPASQVTDAPECYEHDLRRAVRELDRVEARTVRGKDTCGYLYGDPRTPLICPEGDCIPSDMGIIGCRESSGPYWGQALVCINGNETERIYWATQYDPHSTRVCTEPDKPLCNTIWYPDGVASGMTFFTCADTIFSHSPGYYATAFWDYTIDIVEVTTFVKNTSPSTTSAAIDPPPAQGEFKEGSHQPSTVAMAGGIVGGLAGIFLITLAVVLLRRWKKRQNQGARAESPPPLDISPYDDKQVGLPTGNPTIPNLAGVGPKLHGSDDTAHCTQYKYVPYSSPQPNSPSQMTRPEDMDGYCGQGQSGGNQTSQSDLHSPGTIDEAISPQSLSRQVSGQDLAPKRVGTPIPDLSGQRNVHEMA